MHVPSSVNLILTRKNFLSLWKLRVECDGVAIHVTLCSTFMVAMDMDFILAAPDPDTGQDNGLSHCTFVQYLPIM